jgi:hypothetical protein
MLCHVTVSITYILFWELNSGMCLEAAVLAKGKMLLMSIVPSIYYIRTCRKGFIE